MSNMKKVRPFFHNVYDRFVWALENDDWDEDDTRIAKIYSSLYKMAQAKVQKSVTEAKNLPVHA